ncbi:fibronectin-like isoform X2 [Rhipicephalus microplus]|uniref:fibronectin-like isoform X2 n=1 Tax=Rhipicephalus microplus TaxID=6941 RepID=UPI003F6D3807
MATEEKPIPVRYWPKDEAVSLDGKWQNCSHSRKEHQLQQQQNGCTPMTILKISLPIIALMFFALPVITVFVFRHIERISEYGPQSTVLLDLDNLTLVDIGPDHFTVSWMHPVAQFDYYWLEVYKRDDGSDTITPQRVGSCANGTIVHREQTQITCDMFKPCSNVTITLHTQAKGTSELMSTGATLQGIFMPGKVLPDVTNFSLIDVGPDSFTVSWARPSCYFDYYWVEVYDNSNGTDMPTPHRVGSCAYGNIIHRDQNQITCDNFKACVNASITVHAQIKGPSGLTSPGATLRGIFMPGRGLPEVRQLKLTEMDKDSITVSWQRPEGCFDGYIVEVAEENSGRRGVGGLSAGSCAGGISVDAEHTSITCRKIEACSVKITVRTQRKGPLELTSSGVSLHDIVMYKKDMPEVLPTIKVANDTFVLRWNRPTGCFDKYNLEVTYEPYEHSIFKTQPIGSCVGTTVLEPDVTNVTCAHLPACVNTSVILRTQRNGPHRRVSRGEALSVYSKEGDLVDFDLYLDRVTPTKAEIIIDPHLPPSCPPRYCGAGMCRVYKSGAIALSCFGVDCEARNSYSSQMVVKLKHPNPGGFHTCRVTLRYNNEVSKQIGFYGVQ